MIFPICDLNISLYRLLFSTFFTADDELIWLNDIIDPLCTIYLGMYKAQLFIALVHIFQIQKLLPLLMECFISKHQLMSSTGIMSETNNAVSSDPIILKSILRPLLLTNIYKTPMDNIILNDITHYHCPQVTAMQLQIA